MVVLNFLVIDFLLFNLIIFLLLAIVPPGGDTRASNRARRSLRRHQHQKI